MGLIETITVSVGSNSASTLGVIVRSTVACPSGMTTGLATAGKSAPGTAVPLQRRLTGCAWAVPPVREMRNAPLFGPASEAAASSATIEITGRPAALSLSASCVVAVDCGRAQPIGGGRDECNRDRFVPFDQRIIDRAHREGRRGQPIGQRDAGAGRRKVRIGSVQSAKGEIAMRFAALVVLGCLTVPAFAAPQEAPAPIPTPAASDTQKKDSNREVKPTLPTLDLESNRKAGWCGSLQGPAKLACLGPGDTVIAMVGGEEGIPNPILCLDGNEMLGAKRADLGGNRFQFEILSLPPNTPTGVKGHRAFLAAATGKTQPGAAKCSPRITQFVDVAVPQPRLGSTKALLSFLGVIVLVLLLVWKFPAFLKDPKPSPTDTVGPWSLGRVQLAWWTAIVFAGWIVILISTGNYESFTPEALILLGVSVATTATAGLVQTNKEKEKAKAEASRNELEALNANLDANLAPTTVMVASQRLQQIAGEMAVAPIDQGNVGFFSDLLKDGDVPSLARLQAVLWTVALGTIFVWQVLANMEMPAFSKELLFLAGISSGSFLFGKVTERRV